MMLNIAQALFAIAIRMPSDPVVTAPAILSFTQITTNLER